MIDYGVNWERVRRRHAAFWRGERDGACLCSVTGPRDNATWESFPIPTNREDRIRWWTEAEQVIKRHRSWFKDTYFAGDAFPVLIHDLGPAGHAGFFEGASPRFEGSVWFDATLKDYADLRFDPNSFLYKKTVELPKAYAEDANGEYIIAMPDAVGDADVLSHLRGPDVFMMDLMDEPDAVKAALKTVQFVWEQTMRACYDAVSSNNNNAASVGWLQTLAPGFHGQLQCDLSVMISPDMFEEFLCYELNEQSGYLDYSLYHLDGQQQVMHLKHILNVDRIRAIQWTNVAGQPPVTDFIPVLRQIQEAGKSLILDCTPDQVSELMENLSSRLMYIRTWANSQAEADDIVNMVERMTKD